MSVLTSVLAVGGAQAIGALAYGIGRVPACDAIVGPGNAFVTAAKSLIAGSVVIDMLAVEFLRACHNTYSMYRAPQNYLFLPMKPPMRP